MRILYVCHRFPFPPRRGGKIRAFNMIRHLARSHEVVVAAPCRSEAERDEGAGMAQDCHAIETVVVNAPMQLARMIVRLPTRVPSSMGYFYSPRLARQIARRLSDEHFDLVFVHCSSVAHYVSDATGIPKILDFGDMDSQKWLEYVHAKPWPLRPGYWLEGRKLMAEEKRLAQRFDLCTATTKAEWETLEGYRTARATDWFPNGVDTDYFAPSDEPYDADLISFVGRMDYFPNQQCMLDFCASVWPRLRARRKTARLAIVGADPSLSIRRLANLDGVTVTGSVPDVRPYLRRSALTIAPLRIARGTQNKILEAMALGIPVVASRLAAGGVDAVPGEHLLAADSVDEQVEAIASLLERPQERLHFATAGRARMLSHHSWDRSMERLDAIVARCIAEHGRRMPGRITPQRWQSPSASDAEASTPRYSRID